MRNAYTVFSRPIAAIAQSISRQGNRALAATVSRTLVRAILTQTSAS